MPAGIAGFSSILTTFEWIFRREKIDAAIVEGDAYHRYDRVEMRQQMKDAEAGSDPGALGSGFA